VLISARTGDLARIDRVELHGDRIEVELRLADGSPATAMLLDDGINSLELEPGATVFAVSAPGS